MGSASSLTELSSPIAPNQDPTVAAAGPQVIAAAAAVIQASAVAAAVLPVPAIAAVGLPKPVAAAAMTTEMPFEAVESNLREALKKRDLNLFIVVDHGAGANSVGMDIGQSKLFIFGSPKSGTPLMVANPEMGMA